MPSIPASDTLSSTQHAPKWNGGFLEGQYIVSPQWIIIARWETVHMAQRAGRQLRVTPATSTFTIANRWYPFMFSRAGLALQREYSFVRVEWRHERRGRIWKPVH